MPWSNQGGGPWGSGGKGPWGSGPQPSGTPPTDLEELLRRSQDRLRSVIPGGNLGGKGIGLIVLAAVLIWGFSGFFRVEPDELGVVLRFGAQVREVPPGLNYHLPYPIETVLTPKALRVNKIDIGMRMVEDSRRGSTVRDVPEESLMLTGDENIVDVDFSVLWRIKPNGVGEYLFNIQNPEGTVKAVAESAMREVIGRSDIQPILTGARQGIETGVQELMQKTLDSYGAGVSVQQVQLQKVDPPSQVIDSFRDVQAARADLERAQNEAQTYANRVVPEARGRAAQILQAADAYKSQTVAEATGQTSRFGKIYDEYKKAPEVTRKRMYLETMERVMAGTDKIILDSNGQSGSGVVPYLPLNELRRPQTPAAAPAGGTR
jgi:modulator of FtsH protease HflK